MRFADKIKSQHVAPHTVALFWLGQAGFALKTENEQLIFIDPYLTDSVHHELAAEYGQGFKRLSPALFEPGELQPDYLLLSHEHGDHCDVEAVKELADPDRTVCVCNQNTKEIIESLHVHAKEILCVKAGMCLEFPDLVVEIVRANHGAACPGALGFLLKLDGVNIYYSGDTCFDEEIASVIRKMKPDIALLPINGAFGNLDGKQAAMYTAAIGAKVCIPHHFWTFPQHYGNPAEALEAFENYPECRLRLLTPGETFEWRGEV